MKNRLTLALTLTALVISSASFADTAIPSEGLNQYCQDAEQTMDEVYENGALTKCYFNGTSLLDAYTQYRTALIDGQQFLSEKPAINKNVDLPCPSEGCVAIRYRWDGDKNLNVEQEFAGGETHLQFVQDNKGTALEITQHPD